MKDRVLVSEIFLTISSVTFEDLISVVLVSVKMVLPFESVLVDFVEG